MLTYTDLEQLARQMRARGLHSSWIELIEFSQSVVGSLIDAYQALLRDSASSGRAFSGNPGDLQTMLKENLAKALTFLTSEAQVAKWESEALTRTNMQGKEVLD